MRRSGDPGSPSCDQSTGMSAQEVLAEAIMPYSSPVVNTTSVSGTPPLAMSSLAASSFCVAFCGVLLAGCNRAHLNISHESSAGPTHAQGDTKHPSRGLYRTLS